MSEIKQPTVFLKILNWIYVELLLCCISVSKEVFHRNWQTDKQCHFKDRVSFRKPEVWSTVAKKFWSRPTENQQYVQANYHKTLFQVFPIINMSEIKQPTVFLKIFQYWLYVELLSCCISVSEEVFHRNWQTDKQDHFKNRVSFRKQK